MRVNESGIVIQARTSSTRLPGKVLLPFYNNKCILEIIVLKVVEAFPKRKIVVATSALAADDPIVNLCSSLSVQVFRGDERNVLQRFVDTANAFSLTAIARICADNPFLNIKYLQEIVRLKEERYVDADYISYHNSAGLPSIKTHWGLFAEVVTVRALQTVLKQTCDPLYLEHVTNYIYSNPDRFDVQFLKAPDVIRNRNDLRFTIDTESDFRFCRKLYAEMKENGQNENLENIIQLVDNDPTGTYLKSMAEQINLNSK